MTANQHRDVIELEVVCRKALQHAELPNARVLLEVLSEKCFGSKVGFGLYASSAYIDLGIARKVETVDEVMALAREATAAREGGQLPRELLVHSPVASGLQVETTRRRR